MTTNEPKKIATVEELRKRVINRDTVQEVDLGETGIVKIRPLSLRDRTAIKDKSMAVGSSTMDEADFQIHTIIDGTVEPKLSISDHEWIEALPPRIIDIWSSAIWTLSSGSVEQKKKD